MFELNLFIKRSLNRPEVDYSPGVLRALSIYARPAFTWKTSGLRIRTLNGQDGKKVTGWKIRLENSGEGEGMENGNSRRSSQHQVGSNDLADLHWSGAMSGYRLVIIIWI